MQWLTSNLLWSAGLPICYMLVAAAVGAYFVWRPLLIVVAALFLFSFYFFRNPERSCLERQMDPTVLICPADGRVVDVAYDPANGFEGYARKISIFLSPLDVHVNWIPYDGTIKDIVYRPGKFVVAYAPKSSEINERNDIVLATDHGTMLVRQIAGFVARRICWWIKPGDTVVAGQKYGMIRFGSRVDILLPENVEVAVALDQRVVGGQTVLGRWLVER